MCWCIVLAVLVKFSFLVYVLGTASWLVYLLLSNFPSCDSFLWCAAFHSWCRFYVVPFCSCGCAWCFCLFGRILQYFKLSLMCDSKNLVGPNGHEKPQSQGFIDKLCGLVVGLVSQGTRWGFSHLKPVLWPILSITVANLCSKLQCMGLWCWNEAW